MLGDKRPGPRRGRGLAALPQLPLEQLCGVMTLYISVALFSGQKIILIVEGINAEADQPTSFRIKHFHRLVQKFLKRAR